MRIQNTFQNRLLRGSIIFAAFTFRPLGKYNTFIFDQSILSILYKINNREVEIQIDSINHFVFESSPPRIEDSLMGRIPSTTFPLQPLDTF